MDDHNTHPSKDLQVAVFDKENRLRISKHMNLKEKPIELVRFNSFDDVVKLGSVMEEDAGKYKIDGETYTKTTLSFRDIPVDIFLGGNIPSPHVCFEMGDDKSIYQLHLVSREHILQLFITHMCDPTKKETIYTINPIGIIKILSASDQGDIIELIPICIGEDGKSVTVNSAIAYDGKIGSRIEMCYSDDVLYSYLTEEYKEVISRDNTVTVFRAGFFLHAWYNLQIMLLNPLLEASFKRETVPMPSALCKQKKKKAPKKYIKRIVINNDKINELQICSEKNKHNFTEPIWWVQGHWRQYKSGKRVFVQGYWKGPDRWKKELEVPREREIPEEYFEINNIKTEGVSWNL